MKAQLLAVPISVRRPLAIVAWLVGLAAAGLVGYVLGALRQDEQSMMPAGRAPGLEYFFQPRSFSEIENAKALLEAVASQFLSEIRIQRDFAFKKSAGRGQLH